MVRSRSTSRDALGIESLLAEYQQALSVLQDLTTEFAERVRHLDANRTDDQLTADLEDHPPATVEIACLGAFEVRVDGRVLQLPASGRPAAILKLLADRGGRPTSREVLIETLWPDIAADTGANRLRVAIHSLRQIDHELHQLVTFDQGHYQLNGARVEVDAERFEALLAGGHSLEQAGDIDRALTIYHQAEQLYRGDYFEEDPFEDWALIRRQHLRDLYLNLLVKLAVLALERGDYEACITHCHEIVRQDDCSEDAYRLLMLAHAHRGNRARALRWYALCEQTLLRELEVQPSAPTRALRDEILSNEPDDDRSLRQRLGLGALGALGFSIAGVLGTSKTAVAAAGLALGILVTMGDADQLGGVTVEPPPGEVAAAPLQVASAAVPAYEPIAINTPNIPSAPSRPMPVVPSPDGASLLVEPVTVPGPAGSLPLPEPPLVSVPPAVANPVPVVSPPPSAASSSPPEQQAAPEEPALPAAASQSNAGAAAPSPGPPGHANAAAAATRAQLIASPAAAGPPESVGSPPSAAHASAALAVAAGNPAPPSLQIGIPTQSAASDAPPAVGPPATPPGATASSAAANSRGNGRS